MKLQSQSLVTPGMAHPQAACLWWTPLRLAREVFGACSRKPSRKHSGRLAYLNEVAVRIPHVAAKLCAAVNRGSQKGSPPIGPLSVTRADVGNPEIQEDRRGLSRFVIDNGYAGLVRSGRSARVHDDPEVSKPDDAGVLLQYHGSTQNSRVKLT